MSYRCSYCGITFGERHNCEQHETNCIDRYIVGGVPHANYHIYVFVFVAFGKQRYYIGQTANLRERATDHFRRSSKIIWSRENKTVAEPRHMEPLSVHIADTAPTKEKAHIKERTIFIDMVRNIEDSSMVCGGK